MTVNYAKINFHSTRKSKAKILIAQPSWKPSQLNQSEENGCYYLRLSDDNHAFIECILKKAQEINADLIVFPEFSITLDRHKYFQSWSNQNNSIVIAGSAHIERDESYYNTASIFYKGKHYKTDKQRLSPYETSGVRGLGPKSGDDCSVFVNTPVGSLGVLICADVLDQKVRANILKNELDILCVISFQKDSIDQHMPINQIVPESDEGIYVVYANAYCEQNSDGKSAFFGNDYSEASKERANFGVKKQGLKFQQLEMPPEISAGCLIVECSLDKKVVTYPDVNQERRLVKVDFPYLFEGRQLFKKNSIELKELSLNKLNKSNRVVERNQLKDQDTPPNESLMNLVKTATLIYAAGDVFRYRSFLDKNKLVNKLKRAAHFEILKDLSQLDVASSLNTNHARSILSYIQSCLVVYDIESGINVCHEKLINDPKLSNYNFLDKLDFIKSYADLLREAGKPELAILLMHSFLNTKEIKNLPHNRLSQFLGFLGECYLKVDKEVAYSIARDIYDEQCLTDNEFAVNISRAQLGVTLLEKSMPKEALGHFEASAEFFKGFDKRAHAWTELYSYISAIRINEFREESLRSAIDFYSRFGHLSNAVFTAIVEARTYNLGWNDEYDDILSEMSAKITANKVSAELLQLAEEFCAGLVSSSNSEGSYALSHKVSIGEYPLNSVLTNSFMRSLGDKARDEYLNKILVNENFYLTPYYNKLIRYFTNNNPDLARAIIFPHLSKLAKTYDSLRIYYARILEKEGFYKEAKSLLISMEKKDTFSYLNTMGNVKSKFDKDYDQAMDYYCKAHDAAGNNHQKAIALHNKAFLILSKQKIDKYLEAEEFCKQSIRLRKNSRFFSPLETLLLLRVDIAKVGEINQVIDDFYQIYNLTFKQLRAATEKIKNNQKVLKVEEWIADRAKKR